MKTTNLSPICYAVAIFLASVFATMPASANENGGGFYGALEVGNLKLKDWCDNTIGLSNYKCSDSEIAFGADVGYAFNQFFSIEGGLRLVDGFDESAEGEFIADFASFEDGDQFIAKGTAEATSFLLGVRGTFPFNKNFFVYGKTGINRTEVDGKLTINGTGSAASKSYLETATEKSNKIYFGIGAGVNFLENFQARADYTRYKYKSTDADMLAGSIVYRF